MNGTAQDLARSTFQSAIEEGPAEPPTSLSQILSQLDANEQLHSLDTESLGHSLYDDFPFLGPMVSAGIAPDSASSATWEAAVRWVLNALRNWDVYGANALNKLRALLVAVHALDARAAGLDSVAAQVTSSHLTAGLLRIIESTDVGSGFNERRFPEVSQEIESLAKNGNFERLGQLIPHMTVLPSPDSWSAVVLLHKSAPEALASVAVKRNDALFSLLICVVLGAQAVAFAIQVQNAVFKFVSVSHLLQEHRTGGLPQGLGDTLRTLLLQVAQTSDSDWAGWMQAFFKCPGNDSLLDAVMASVLVELDVQHRTAFLKALSLGYSHRAAAPVANIMAQFAQMAEEHKQKAMWNIAYQIWSDWNYAKGESQAHMFAPAACALDYPVAMHYSSLPPEELSAEERRLKDGIEMVEQQWFDSASDLITERNRFLSRLRLVQHAIGIAAGGTQLLPPQIQPDADLYVRTRYHYHNVNID